MIQQRQFFLPKDDQKLPDHYTITVTYIDGSKEDIVCSTVEYNDKAGRLDVFNRFTDYVGHGCPYITIWTFDDEMIVIPLVAIRKIQYDKEWSKLVAIREEHMKKRREEARAAEIEKQKKVQQGSEVITQTAEPASAKDSNPPASPEAKQEGANDESKK
jgi:hypothetical protein